MKTAAATLILAIFLLFPADSKAQTHEQIAVLDVMQKVFDAVQSQNAEDWKAIQLADGTTLSFGPNPDGGEPTSREMRISRNEDFVASMSTNDREYLERWTAEPTVMIRGPIAAVWGEYEFWIDGEFSHCGVDSVDLVKLDGEWKLANIMWTVETDDCPTDPSN